VLDGSPEPSAPVEVEVTALGERTSLVGEDEEVIFENDEEVTKFLTGGVVDARVTPQG
jgi:hypothetical protein